MMSSHGPETQPEQSRDREGAGRGLREQSRDGEGAGLRRGKTGRFLTGAALIIASFLGFTVPTLGADPQTDAINAAAPGGLLEALLFYAVAGSTVLSALGVCVAKNIVRMAVWLFVGLGSVAMLYFLLAANFLGAIQLIVYVGGTLVLLVFGVMLTSKSPWVRFDPPKVEMILAAIVCTALAVSLCTVLAKTAWSSVERIVPGATVASLGQRLLTTYLVPFEVAGVLLMIVMVGAAYLARQEE